MLGFACLVAFYATEFCFYSFYSMYFNIFKVILGVLLLLCCMGGIKILKPSEINLSATYLDSVEHLSSHAIAS